MAISSMVIQVTSEIDKVVAELSKISGVTVHTTTPKQEVIIVVEALTLEDLSQIAENLQTLPGVIGVFPAYVTTEDEDAAN